MVAANPDSSMVREHRAGNLLGAAALLWALHCARGQTAGPTPAPTPNRTELRIGLHSSYGSAETNQELATFLLAVQEINADPGLHLGDPNFVLKPYVANATFDTHEARAVHAMGELVAPPMCYHNILAEPVGVTPSVGHDVHTVVSSRGSGAMTRSALVAALHGKPVVGASATSDALGDRVSPCLLPDWIPPFLFGCFPLPFVALVLLAGAGG